MYNWIFAFVVDVQLPSHVGLFMSPGAAACQASLSLTVSWSLHKFMSVESVMPSNHLILCHPLLLLPSIFPSIRVFSYESALSFWWSKYWSFSFSISPSKEYSLQDWLVWFPRFPRDSQESSPSPQFESINSSALSHPDVTTGEIIALTVWTFVGQVMSLLFNTLSRFVVAFIPRSNHLLRSWLRSPSAVILEPKKRKSIMLPL